MDESSSNARLLAPLAVAAAMVAVVFVVFSSTGGSDDSAGEESPPARESGTGETATGNGETATGRLPERTYIVKPGDNFDAISEKTGIPTNRLLELNPDLDPQALISGQRVRLR